MIVEINNYIDFGRLFDDLYKLHESDLHEYQYEADHYKRLIEFYSVDKAKFELMVNECQLNDTDIVFFFGYDFNDANESNNQSTTADYTIVYDTLLEEFTRCDYEQG